jgi:single-strand DNA-binding protein
VLLDRAEGGAGGGQRGGGGGYNQDDGGGYGGGSRGSGASRPSAFDSDLDDDVPF